MRNPLISIIVPIYMIDKYLGLCIESIIKQTYKNLEIILVDDGSKDRCSEICDLYQRKDKRIRVIHKSNGGLVSARKVGFMQSEGEYVTFVDGDDWIEPEFIEQLYAAAETNNADMVCAGQTRTLFSKSVSFINALPLGVYEGQKLKDLWKSMISYAPYYRPGIMTYVWNKLFRRESLRESLICVDSRISIGEDGAITYPALLNCSCVAVVDNVGYHYRQREDSMLKQSDNERTEIKKIGYLYKYLLDWAANVPKEYEIKQQIQEYVSSIAVIRSTNQLLNGSFSVFDTSYYGKDVIVYSAGTFGQQLVKRLKENQNCQVIACIDDDYWEYRRCCLDVDSVESIKDLTYDFILIATVDGVMANNIKRRLLNLGVKEKKILKLSLPEDKGRFLEEFLAINGA